MMASGIDLQKKCQLVWISLPRKCHLNFKVAMIVLPKNQSKPHDNGLSQQSCKGKNRQFRHTLRNILVEAILFRIVLPIVALADFEHEVAKMLSCHLIFKDTFLHVIFSKNKLDCKFVCKLDRKFVRKFDCKFFLQI